MQKLTPVEKAIKAGLDRIHKDMEDIQRSYDIRMQKAQNIKDQWIRACPHNTLKPVPHSGGTTYVCELCNSEI